MQKRLLALASVHLRIVALKTPRSYNALIIKQYNINRLYHINNLLFCQLKQAEPTIGSEARGKFKNYLFYREVVELTIL